MLTIFNTESLYVGTDIKRFHEIREILDLNKIKYKYKTKNQLGEWSGCGTIRGNVGSLTANQPIMYEYEIKVMKCDYENAKYIIRK